MKKSSKSNIKINNKITSIHIIEFANLSQLNNSGVTLYLTTNVIELSLKLDKTLFIQLFKVIKKKTKTIQNK